MDRIGRERESRGGGVEVELDRPSLYLPHPELDP